jgi:hypothetical protein
MMKVNVKKNMKNSIIQDHVIPTLIVIGWFGILLVLAIMVTNG